MRFLLIFVLLGTLLRAEDLYYTQSGAGSKNGTSSGNAWDASSASTGVGNSGNWGAGAGKISAGDTIHAGGTVTTQFSFLGSGTAGNYITWQMDSGAKMSSTAWPGSANNSSDGAVAAYDKSYVIVDGGTNGIIENTANGTGLANSVKSCGVNFGSTSHAIIKNLAINNLYVRTRGSEAQEGGTGIRVRATGSSPTYTDIRITNNVQHDTETGIGVQSGSGGISTIEIDHNTVYNCNWGGSLTDTTSSTTTGSTIHDNYFHDFINWDGTDAPSQALFHHNGFYAYAESGGTLGDVTFYSNMVGPNWSTGSPNHATAGIFVSGSGVQGPIIAYNNIGVDSSSSDYPSNGHIFFWNGANCVNRMYNNTSVGVAPGGGIAFKYDGGNASGQTLDVKNNIVISKTAISVFNNGNVTLTASYNEYYALISGEEFSTSSNTSSSFKSYATWQGLGYDVTGSVTTSPNLNGSYVPQPSSGAINAGTTLSSYFTTDYYGLTRPQGAAWDIGAAEYPTSSTGGNSVTGQTTFTGKISF